MGVLFRTLQKTISNKRVLVKFIVVASVLSVQITRLVWLV